MIRGFRHKGLKRLFEDGERKGVRPNLLEKVENILFVLNRAKTPDDMKSPRIPLAPAQRRPERFPGGYGAGKLANRFPV